MLHPKPKKLCHMLNCNYASVITIVPLLCWIARGKGRRRRIKGKKERWKKGKGRERNRKERGNKKEEGEKGNGRQGDRKDIKERK